MAVIWRVGAANDLNEITTYWDTVDTDVSDAIEEAIIQKALYFGRDWMAGSAVEGCGPSYKVGYVFKQQTYKIYYRIMSPGTIRILMIRDSRRKPPTPGQIRRRG